MNDKNTNAHGLPLIPLDLSAHKLPIFLAWFPIVLTSGILPIAGYFALEYGTNEPLGVVLAPWVAIFGIVSLFSLSRRTYSLVKKTSATRPLGSTSAWTMDYFNWNFIFGFVVLTIVISLGTGLESLHLASLPHSILIFYVCAELLLAQLAMATGTKAPFRFSSIPKGDPVRPGTYIVAEDIIAVDGKQGQAFRQAWSDRYAASSVFRAHMRRMDLLWGATGLAVVAVVFGVVFGQSSRDAGYVVGWALPWVWAGTMAFITTRMSKAMLRKEAEMQRGGEVA